VESRIAKAKSNKLGKSDFHSTLAALIMPLNWFIRVILRDLFGYFERLPLVQAPPVVGGPAQIGDMFNQYMDRGGQVILETGGESLLESLFNKEGHAIGWAPQ